jgi:hypothetical protein
MANADVFSRSCSGRIVGYAEVICPGSGLVMGSRLIASDHSLTTSAFVGTNPTDESIVSELARRVLLETEISDFNS